MYEYYHVIKNISFYIAAVMQTSEPHEIYLITFPKHLDPITKILTEFKSFLKKNQII